MPFSIDEFTSVRPYVYHLTAQRNLARIRQRWLLQSAEELMNQAQDPDLPTDRKRGSLDLNIGGEVVHLRDQDPLYQGNIKFDEGWDFRRFIRLLNGHVFFWPGKDGGPNDYGNRHYLRYQSEGPAIIRMKVADLVSANPTQPPRFCRYNSGSPRCSNGLKSPRGAETFVSSATANFSAAKAVEIVVPGHVVLPVSVQVGESPQGPWRTLTRS